MISVDSDDHREKIDGDEEGPYTLCTAHGSIRAISTARFDLLPLIHLVMQELMYGSGVV